MLSHIVRIIRKFWHKDISFELKEIEKYLVNLNYKLAFLMEKNLVKIQNSELELSLLFDKYYSDKGSICNPTVHTYTETYHRLFSPIRNEVKAVFECGIFKGASLRAWRDYFTNAIIIGGDLNSDFLFEELRIHTALLNQLDPDGIKTFFKNLAPGYPDQFDVMIDDGCHTYKAAICLFENAFQYLKMNYPALKAKLDPYFF